MYFICVMMFARLRLLSSTSQGCQYLHFLLDLLGGMLSMTWGGMIYYEVSSLHS